MNKNTNNEAGETAQSTSDPAVARGICWVGISGMVVFLVHGAILVWEGAQDIPLIAWLEAFGILGAISVGVGVFGWAARRAKF